MQSLMNIVEGVDLIVAALEVSKAELRKEKDKIRKRLIYAIGAGKLKATTFPDINLERNDLIVWARSKWPQQLMHLKTRQDADAADSLAISVSFNANHYPGTIEDCHQHLGDAYQTIRVLSLERARLMAEVEVLKPLAEKYERNREMNRQSASKPRKGGWES